MEPVSLTYDQAQTILNAMQSIELLRQQYQDLKECGEDCQLRMAKIDNLHKNLNSLYHKFAPK